MGDCELMLHLLDTVWLNTYVAQKIPTRFRSVLELDDLLQEIHLAAVESVSGFDESEPHAFERWLTSIAQRKLIDAIRIAKAIKRGGPPQPARTRDRQISPEVDLFHQLISPTDTPSGVFANHEEEAAVKFALTLLNPDRRKVVYLRFYEDRSYKQIAARMGRSTSAVGSLLYRALRQLRGLLRTAVREVNERERRAAQRDD